jgi:hypothetical protein
MMMRRKPIYKYAGLWLAGLLLLSTLTGCALLVAGGAAAGATYSWVSGWLEKDYQADLDDTYQACLRATKNLGMTVTDKSLDIASGEIKATKANTTYRIKLKSKGEKLTTVSVRAGILGDRQASEKIQRTIQNAL